MRLLIIGSGAAGLTAAQFARKTDRQAEITVLGNEGYGEYSKCGLPYVIGGVIPSLDDLIEFSVSWFQRFNIDLRPESEASDVDPKVKVVKAVSLRDRSEEEYRYDVLLIATGASSWIPDVKGIFAGGGVHKRQSRERSDDLFSGKNPDAESRPLRDRHPGE